MPKLVVNAGTPQAREFELKPGTNYLGRGFANDFKIEDPSVSGSHAQIVLNGGAVMVKDLGSTNGTFINRSPVTEAALQSGQLLRLGGVEMLFQCEAAASVAVSSVVPGLTAMPPAPRTNGVRVTAPSAPPPVPRLSSPAIAAAPAPPVAATLMTAGSPPPAPPAAPPLAPAIVPGMVDAPPGMTTCKYHPKTAGQWLCQSCRLLFCSLCVSTRRTEAGTGYFCRKCATECVPVKVNYVAPKEKTLKEYSDVTVLVRSLSFGFGAAILAGVIWTGIAASVGFVIPGLFCWLTGILCGFSVKTACQDRPGIIFCLIAVGSCLLGIAFGEVGMALTVGYFGFGIWSIVGFMGGLFSAWRIGGGDF
jgi:hypothetical protein